MTLWPMGRSESGSIVLAPVCYLGFRVSLALQRNQGRPTTQVQ